MGSIYFILGMIVGLVAGFGFCFAAMLDVRHDSTEHITKKMQYMANRITAQKGGVLYPKSEDVIAMEELFERNDKKGRDTEIGKILEGDE